MIVKLHEGSNLGCRRALVILKKRTVGASPKRTASRIVSETHYGVSLHYN